MAPSQLTIAALFTAAPLTVMPLLDRSARLDLIDLYEAGMEAAVTNRYDGTSRMTEMTDSLLTLELTPVSSLVMRLTPDSIIETIHSIEIPEGKRVTTHRYDTQWTPIRSSLPGINSTHTSN